MVQVAPHVLLRQSALAGADAAPRQSAIMALKKARFMTAARRGRRTKCTGARITSKAMLVTTYVGVPGSLVAHGFVVRDLDDAPTADSNSAARIFR
jgi:hypothetical protein